MIGIIGAMQVEIDAILAHAEIVKTIDNGGLPMYYGVLEDQEVLIATSGVGSVSAAMVTTQLLERYAVSTVINVGTAGGLKQEEQVLDVVISDRLTKHDFDMETVFGVHNGIHENNPLVYQTDRTLQEIAKQTMEDVSEARVWIGDMVSGDVFITRPEDVKHITTNFPSALCGDMEAAIVAQICAHYKVPFVVIRSLSDIAVKEGNAMQFDSYAEQASHRSALFVKAFIKAWAAHRKGD